MRVLYFSRDYTTHDRRFLRKLAESPHEVGYLRLEDDGIAYESRPLPPRIQLVEWPGGKVPIHSLEALLSLMPHLQSVLDRIRPDLVHAGPVQSCGFLAALTGFHPLLVMSWGSDLLVDADRDNMTRSVTSYTLNRADRMLCDCQAVRWKAEQLAGYPADRIVQFPWGVDLEKFVPGPDSLGLRSGLGWEQAFVILSTRTWEPMYGMEVLLEAFRRAQARNPLLRLLLLGTGSLAPRIARFLADHSLSRYVLLPGQVPHDQLPDYYRAANLYMSCAPSDGTSISLLEAMATGLPVVVTDAGGNQEWVTPGKNGWLAPAGEPETFAQAVLLAAELSPRERSEMAKRNREIAEGRANWDRNCARLLEAYEQLGGRSLT